MFYFFCHVSFTVAWLTVFTTLKLDEAFLKDTGQKQRNFRTWLAYTETKPEWQWLALITGNCSLLQKNIRCEELRLRHHSFIYKMPLISEVLKRARMLARTKYLFYANVDNIILGDIEGAIEQAQKSTTEHHVFMSSRAIGVHTRRQYNFASDTDKAEFHSLQTTEFWWPGWACEAFLFNRANPLVDRMPPFLVGRIRWDNWLLQFAAMHNDVASIETTGYIRVYHLNHGENGTYDHSAAEKPGTDYNIWLSESYGGIEYGNHACMRYKIDSDGNLTRNNPDECLSHRRYNEFTYSEVKHYVNS